MKKLLIILLFSFCFTINSVFALTVAWDANPEGTLGYTIYWQEQSEDIVEEFRADVPGRETTQYVIEDKFLKVGVTYQIWATAYNDQDNSISSEVITGKREYTFSPPTSNLPTITYEPTKPTKIIINATP